jgi:uncharacterized protein YbjT (DUF2867 family)
MISTQRPIGIVGGLGKTGRRVAKRLLDLDLAVRPLSRSTEPGFDWASPDGWGEALAGLRQIYVTFQPDLSVPGADALIARLAEVARRQGVERMILLSGRGEDGALRAEQALAQAGLPWAVVRSSWFAQNFTENFLADAVASGTLVIPTGTAAEPFVDTDDIADVVVQLLTGNAPMGRVYEVTGPTALRFPEACAILSEASSHALECREVEVPEFEEYLRAGGLPEEMVMMMVDLFTVTLDGRNSIPANGVREALGRPPRTFRQFAQDAGAATTAAM